MKKEIRLHTMDLISHLSDPIVHHIMSFLTTSEVTKLSILSRRFFSLWGSFPVIELDQKRFSRTCQSGATQASITNGFLDHVLNSVRLRTMDTVLSEFRVNADLETTSTDDRFDMAILLVLVNGVKCMELNLGFGNYLLPAGFASTSMNVLRFQGLQLDLSHLIRVCPSLRTVSLTSCTILDDVSFSSETLTEIEFRSCHVKFIKIKARNLQLFVFSGDKNDPKPCQIDVLQCENIIYLSLNDVLNGRDWIEEHVHSLSKLKTFILNGCEDIESIRVWNDKLERVELGRCYVLTSIELITRSLESFVYNDAIAFLGRFCNITFSLFSSKHIKDLSLEGLLFTDQWLETQLANMTHLEKLSLKDCNSLKKIKVCHEKLQILEIYSCNSLVEADINTPQLVSFVYHGDTTTNLGTFITDQWLEAQLAKMTRLEKLKLQACDSLKKAKVCHEKLQILELDSCNGLVEADIDTPQLISFAYHGDLIEFDKMVTRSSCTATLSMKPWIRYDDESFRRWRNLLSFFGHCKALKLICRNYKEVMIPELQRDRLVSPLYDLQHLEIQIKSLEKIDRDLVDGLLWLSPLPKILHVSSVSRSSRLEMVIKFVYNDMIEGEEKDNNPWCCETKLIKCWKHHLKRLEIQSSDVSLTNESIELQNYFLTNTKILDSLDFSLNLK